MTVLSRWRCALTDTGQSQSEGEAGEETQKKFKIEAELPTKPQPLTRQNLAILEGRMADPEASIVGEEHSESENSGDVTAPKATKSRKQSSVRDILEDNGLYIDLKEVAGEARTYVTKAKDIINVKRLSPFEQDKQDDFLEQRKEYELRNEGTFVWYIWPLIVGLDRSVATQDENSKLDEHGLFVKKWRIDGLDANHRQKFETGSIPKLNTNGDPILEKILRDDGRVQLPEPDLAYALRRNSFPELSYVATAVDRKYKQLSKGITYPFLVLEFKSKSGAITEAELQACRSGAALVNYMRNLKKDAKDLDNVSAEDYGSFVFSLPMDQDHAHLHVHWAQKRSNRQVYYHMSFIKAYSLKDGEQVALLRHDMNNILEWGVGARKQYIKELLIKIKVEIEKPKSSSGSSNSPSKKQKTNPKAPIGRN